MSQQELLKKVITILEETGIPYMVTGSIASSLQGEPRASHDIDIVVDISREVILSLLEAFPSPHYYLSRESIESAIFHKKMFNLIDIQEGDKVDFWLLTRDPFDESRFARRYQEEILGMRLYLSSPEDTILAKLRWAKLSGAIIS